MGFAIIIGFFLLGSIQTKPLLPSPSTVIVIAEAPLGEISSDFEERCRTSSQWILPCLVPRRARELKVLRLPRRRQRAGSCSTPSSAWSSEPTST